MQMMGEMEMENDWDKAIGSLSKINVYSNPNNEPVTISGEADDLKCIGVGTDAAVFQALSARRMHLKYMPKTKCTK